MLLALLVLFLFVAVPVAMGYVFSNAMAARTAWLGFGALMAYSQSRDDELGGMWVVVGLFVLIGLLLVQLGHRLRKR